MVDIKTIVEHENTTDHVIDPLTYPQSADDWARSAESLQLVDIICAMMAQQEAVDARW
jgi:hypothetical protein